MLNIYANPGDLLVIVPATQEERQLTPPPSTQPPRKDPVSDEDDPMADSDPNPGPSDPIQEFSSSDHPSDKALSSPIMQDPQPTPSEQALSQMAFQQDSGSDEDMNQG